MRSALITGAASGIGLTTAHYLSQQGWRVFAGVLPAEDTAALLTGAENITLLQLDITDAEQVAAAVDCIAQENGGKLDALVNNAGIVTVGAMEVVPLQTLRTQFEVNVFGHIQVTQAMLPLLRAPGDARIINVLSLMGRVSIPLLGGYSMTKHALESFSDVLRLELAGTGIHVIAIEPGAIRTQMAEAMTYRMKAAADALPEKFRAAYDKLYRAMTHALERQTASGNDPQKVAQAIHKGLMARKPKPRYVVGADAAGLLMMRKFAPDEIADAILSRALKLPR